jgi:hypothetical protein
MTVPDTIKMIVGILANDVDLFLALPVTRV